MKLYEVYILLHFSTGAGRDSIEKVKFGMIGCWWLDLM